MNLMVDLIDRFIGASGKQRLSIMIYHRVLPEYDYMRPGDPTVETFDWHMQLISKYFSPLSLSEALHLLEVGKLPDRAVCVTFDDGYADNLFHALPILDKWNISATVFVATGYLDGGRMWNDTVLDSIKTCPGEYVDLSEFGLGKYSTACLKDRYETAHAILVAIKHLEQTERMQISKFIGDFGGTLSNDLMLTSDQLKKLKSSGVEIGAHTHTHPILCKLDSQEAEGEIRKSTQILEKLTEADIKYFAYPNGKYGIDYDSNHVAMVKKCGFSAALTTQKGVSDIQTDRFQLPRFTPWDDTRFKFLTRLMTNQRELITDVQ